jgi:DNA-3-methyladenine glycosylase II
MQTYSTPDHLAEAVAILCKREPRFKPVCELHGLPSLRTSPSGIEGLLMIVTEQFLSLSAAAAIWSRIANALQPLTAETILATSPDELRGLGLSAAKAKTFHAVAKSCQTRELDFAALAGADGDSIQKKLCALPGIGPWTSDIYLLSCLARADAWPTADLALQHSAQSLFELAERPTPRDMQFLAEPWRPHRAAAARLLWSHYRGLKGLRQA